MFLKVCDSIINTLRRIRAELISLAEIEGLNGADKSDSSDGNEIVGIGGVGVILVDDIGNQPQIVDYQLVTGLFAARGDLFDTLGLLF